MLPHSIRLEIPTKTFPSEEALVEHLLIEHQGDDARFLYRGQTREYRRRWPLTDGPFRDLVDSDLVDRQCWVFEPASLAPPIPLRRGTMDLPSLIPTNTRAYERYLQGGDGRWKENAFEDMMVYFWTAVCTFIVGLACRLWRDQVGLAWLDNQWSSDYPALYKLRSLGQHYGMDTGLLDASASIPVALWFATHDFGSGAHRPGDSAVLYRIDRNGLRDVENWLRAIPEHDGEFDAASIDIRDTPSTIAPRASRQHGWSLVGWDHPRLVIRMAADGFLRRYLWPTGPAPSAINQLTCEDLAPSTDPTGILFKIFWETQPRSLQEVQHWIDQYWNVAAAQRIVLDEDGEWMEQLPREIERIYTAHAEWQRAALAAKGVTFPNPT